jgi:hypothetical protein
VCGITWGTDGAGSDLIGLVELDHYSGGGPTGLPAWQISPALRSMKTEEPLEDWEWGSNPTDTSGVLTWERRLTFNLVHDLLDYRHGHLYWRHNGLPAAQLCADGYMRLTIQGHSYLEHRVIFLGEHGYVEEEIDHINRIRHDKSGESA